MPPSPFPGDPPKTLEQQEADAEQLKLTQAQAQQDNEVKQRVAAAVAQMTADEAANKERLRLKAIADEAYEISKAEATAAQAQAAFDRHVQTNYPQLVPLSAEEAAAKAKATADVMAERARLTTAHNAAVAEALRAGQPAPTPPVLPALP